MAREFGPGKYDKAASEPLAIFIQNWRRRAPHDGGPLEALRDHEDLVWGVQASGFRKAAQGMHDLLLGDVWELAVEDTEIHSDKTTVVLKRHRDGREVSSGLCKFPALAHSLAVLLAYQIECDEAVPAGVQA